MDDVKSKNLIKSVIVVDAKNWDEEEIISKTKLISNQKKEGELYLVTTLSLESSLNTNADGQILTIIIKDVSVIDGQDIENLLISLGNLRDYYPNLTIKVVDESGEMPTNGLPDDTIINNQKS